MASRRKTIAVVSTVLIAALALTVAWFWWLPAAARSRLETAVERYGLELRNVEVATSFSGVRLSHLDLGSEDGAVEVRLDTLRVNAPLWGLLLEGRSAIKGIEAHGCDVRVDTSADSLPDILRRFRGAALPGSEEPREAHRAAPTLVVSGLQLSVDDEVGRLLRMEGGTLTSRGRNLEAAASKMSVGSEDDDFAGLHGMSLVLDRADGRFLLSEFRAQGGEIIWRRRDADPEEATFAWLGFPADAAPDAAPDHADAAAEAPARPGIFARLRALRAFARTESGRPSLSGTAAGEDRAEDAADDAEPFWQSAFTADALLNVSNMEVKARTEDGEQAILGDLTAELRRTGQAELRATGSGVYGNEGTLEWNLALMPLELRGEGSVTFTDLPLALLQPVLPALPWHEPWRSRISGDVLLEGDGAERLKVRGQVSLRALALESPRFAPTPIHLARLGVRGEGVWLPAARRLEVQEAEISLGETRTTFAGALQRHGGRYLVDITASLPPTDCSAAVSAIPPDLLGEADGFAFRGQLGARVRAHIDSEALDDSTLDIRVAESCIFETVPAIADLRRVQGPFLHRVLEPDGTWFEMTTGPFTANWAPIRDISPFLVQAVLAHEDASFFRHAGFAPWAIRDALVRNLKRERFVSGASTITMQLAKNLFLHREKTLARKVQEVLLTWWLEEALAKSDILELYLNVIEYGPSIYGIRSASKHYFGREPADLSPAESAFLASILPNPKAFHRNYERGQLSAPMSNRVRRLLAHMAARGRIDAPALEYGLAELASFRFHGDDSPPPPPRSVIGSAAPLPIASGSEWEAWEDDAPDTPDPTELN